MLERFLPKKIGEIIDSILEELLRPFQIPQDGGEIDDSTPDVDLFLDRFYKVKQGDQMETDEDDEDDNSVVSSLDDTMLVDAEALRAPPRAPTLHVVVEVGDKRDLGRTQSADGGRHGMLGTGHVRESSRGAATFQPPVPDPSGREIETRP